MFGFLRQKNSVTQIIVGLGNPGLQYARTRHNVGFMAVDYLAAKYGAGFRGKFQAELAEAAIGGTKCLLVKPQTFMNLSGRAVREVLNWHKLTGENLIVIHDDMDISFGSIRLRSQGGSAGHNGLKSIIAELGTKDFSRVKIGVGRPPEGWDPADYVLGTFRKDEAPLLEKILTDAGEAVCSIVNDGIIKASNLYNRNAK